MAVTEGVEISEFSLNILPGHETAIRLSHHIDQQSIPNTGFHRFG
jgi:hypothetical protein